MGASEFVQVTCTTCPIGCRVTVEMQDGKPVGVTGNKCKRGDDYSRAEVTDPKRVLTTTVWVKGRGGEKKLLPVRTKSAIPKKLLTDAMRRLTAIEVSLPIARGQVVEHNLLDTGIDVIASRGME